MRTKSYRTKNTRVKRVLKQVYRLDYAVTSNQKKILNAFEMTENDIKHKSIEISNQLKGCE